MILIILFKIYYRNNWTILIFDKSEKVILNEVKNPGLQIDDEVPLGFFTSFRMTNLIFLLIIQVFLYNQYSIPTTGN
jgi:hypothetical protein